MERASSVSRGSKTRSTTAAGRPPRSSGSSRDRGLAATHSGRSSAPLERTAGSPLSQISAIGSVRAAGAGAGPKRLSSLDLMRMKIDAQISACPKDERKTREYLQRQKVACGLTLSRRVVGRPADDASSREHESFYDGQSVASEPAADDSATELPRLSASAPPSPHQHGIGSPRQPEEVRKSHPRWDAAHSLSRDKNALTSRARLEGDVSVEFKIPYGVTWSTDMSTKPRVWCDFILDRPKRMWNWGNKLEKIQDETEIGAAQAVEAASRGSASSGWADESTAVLKTVVGALCTRQDIADAHHAKKMAVKSERMLRRLFALSVPKKGVGTGIEENPVESAVQQLRSGALAAIGPDDTESEVHELAVPDGVIDMRAFSLLLTRLNVFNELVSKTNALNIIADIKGDNKNISFPHFRAALKQIITLGGKSMVEVMCLHHEEGPGWERSPDPLEEMIRDNRDQHVVNEREVLKTIIEEIRTISSGPPTGGGSVSTYGLKARTGALQQQELGKHEDSLAESEAPLLLDLKSMLEGMEEELHRSAAEDAEALANRGQLDKDLRGIMSAAQQSVDTIFESQSAASSPLKSTSSSPLPRSPLPRRSKPKEEPALKEALDRHVLEVQDTRETMNKAIHLVRLTKGRAKAPSDDLDRGDMYFTDSESEEDDMVDEDAGQPGLFDELNLKREAARKQMQTELELMHTDDADPNMETEVLDLIETVCKECEMECDNALVARIMRGARSPWESMKHNLIDTVKNGNNRQAMSALIRSLQYSAEHDSIMALLKYFLRELRAKRPVPSCDAAWAFRLSAKPQMQVPKKLLTFQAVNLYYKYFNEAAEKAAAVPDTILDGKEKTFHPVLGLGGQNTDNLPPELVGPPRLPPLDLDTKPATPSSPPRSSSPSQKEPEAREDTASSKGESAEQEVGAVEGEEAEAAPPPPSGEQLLVEEIKKDMIKLRVRQGRRKQEAEMRGEWELKRMRGGLEAEMQKRLEPAKSLLQHPAGDWIGVCRLRALEVSQSVSGRKWIQLGVLPPKEGRKLTNSKLSHALMRSSGLRWACAGASQPSEGRDLANEELAKALGKKTDFTQQEWDAFGISHVTVDDFMQSGGSYYKPTVRTTEFTQKEWSSFGISDLRKDDFVKSGSVYFKPAASLERIGDELEGLQTSALTEELSDEIAALQRQSAYLAAQDVFAEVAIVPVDNEGAIALPRGISIPGTYVLKYFTEGSPLPLAVSDRFVVEFPAIGITGPAEVEIGRTFKLTMSIKNFDFEGAVAAGTTPPQMSSTDTVAIFSLDDKLQEISCVWSARIENWTKSKDLKISTFRPPSPGQYRIKYMLGLYSNYVAGETTMLVKFPRRGANRFATFELETLTIQEIREARIFVSLCPEDMDKEINIIMKEVAALVQAEVEDANVSCTFVCLNFRQDREETTFQDGICHAIRRSLGEIDMCRPFFVSVLGERYGLVPELTQRDSDDIKQMYEEYPWMQKFKNPFVNTALGYSMLEIEHLYSVLMVEPEGALVYTRDLGYVQNHVPPDERKRYLEVGCGNMKTTAARSASSDLKMRLRAVHGLENRNYDHPKQIAEMLKKDLSKVIRQRFPPSSAPRRSQKIRIMTESVRYKATAHFLLMNSDVWIDMISQIDEAIEQDSCKLLVVAGPVCSGKTALFACWKKQHVLKYAEHHDGARIEMSSCVLPDGPQADLAPHMVICSFISNLVDMRIDAVLRHLYTEIRRLSNCELKLPVEGEYLAEFSGFMVEAAKHGLIWVIDNLDLIAGVDEWGFLSRVPKGVVVLATCNSGRADFIQAVTAATPDATSTILISPLDPGDIWSLQQHYCQAYGLKPDDELIWKVVESETITESGEIRKVQTVGHVRVILMAHRLMSAEGALINERDIEAMIKCPDSTSAFVKLVVLLQTWEPMLCDVVMMIAWSNRGLREMELLALVGSLNQAQLRRYKQIMLDELLMPLFGVYDFVNPSMKLALRRSMLAKGSSKDLQRASSTLHMLIDFFHDLKNGSDLRRSVECPTIFSSDTNTETFFGYLTNSKAASMLVSSGQIHLAPKYVQKIGLTLTQYVGLILDDIQHHFGIRQQTGQPTKASSGSRNTLVDADTSMRKIFEMFATPKVSADTAIKTIKGNFPSKKDSSYTMSLEEWMHAIEYLELMDETEENFITESEAFDIYQHASGVDEQPEISYTEFRFALMQVGKRVGLQLNDMLYNCVQIAQLHRLFNFYAAGAVADGSNAAGSGGVGQRARTLDVQEFFRLIDHVGLSKRLSKSDTVLFFKLAKQHGKKKGGKGEGDKSPGPKSPVGLATPLPRKDFTRMESAGNSPTKQDMAGENDDLIELDYFELKWCIRAVAAHLQTDLDHLVGKVLQSYFTEEASLEMAPQYIVDMARMDDDMRQRYVAQSTSISVLFCELGAYEGSMDIAELMLCNCYGVVNFQDIGNPDAKLVYGHQELVIEVLTTYTRSAYQQTLNLVQDRAEMQQHLDEKELLSNDAHWKEMQRRKQFHQNKRSSIAERREDDELHAAYLRKAEKINKDIEEIRTAMKDNTNQLRWVRRRASTAGLAAKNFLVEHEKRKNRAQTHAPSAPDPHPHTITRLHSCAQVFDRNPESRWGVIREQVKNMTKNPLDCHDEVHINMSMPLENVVLAVLAKFKPDSKLKTKLKGGLSKLSLLGD